MSVGAIAGTEDMAALPPGVREQSYDYVEDTARDSLFPPEPIKSATPASFQSEEVAVPVPVSTRHTTRSTNTSTDGDGSDGSDIPF